MSKLKKRMYIFLERLAARFCDRMIAVTNLDIKKGLAEGIGDESKYMTIRSGIDFSKFENYDRAKAYEFRNLYRDKKIIGMVGRLSEQKNPLDLVRIAKILADRHKDLHFIMIGDGPLRKQVQEYINENKLESYITLLGVRTDVNDILHAFDIFVLTSLWEGLPRAILEAMYCRVPIVANSVDGVAEIIKDEINGFLTVPRDINDACGKIENLLEDEKLRKSIAENAAITLYPEYDAEHMVMKIEELYEEIMNSKKISRE